MDKVVLIPSDYEQGLYHWKCPTCKGNYSWSQAINAMWDNPSDKAYCAVCMTYHDITFQEKVNKHEQSSKLLDAEIAVKKYGWKWENPHGIRKILVPPEGDEKRYWTAIWDENGIPNFLPRYSEMENK